MAQLYGQRISREELLKRVGDISQIAEARHVQLVEGNERGVDAVEFRTGTGFNFTVLPGRGMDISYAEYCGKPLCWRSSTGDVASPYYDPEGLRWLRNFFGGLVATCGLTTAGAPSTDQGEELGLHGRIGNTPAKHVWVDGAWDGDDYVMWAQGKMRETRVFGENLQLTRKITAKLGETRFWIQDTVENMGYETSPLMILYHINGGYPAIDGGTELISPTTSATPRDEDARVDAEHYYKIEPPTPHFRERCYYHDMKADSDGFVTAALVNKGIPGGFGFYVKYRPDQLNTFTEWKMNGEGTYTVGMEPANCRVQGRALERERGTLQFIQPGEKRQFDLEIGVLTSLAEIKALEAKTKETLG